MTAAKVMDIISRLQGCAGQAADSVSAYTQVKMEDAPKLFKISTIGMSRHLDSSSTTQNDLNHGPVSTTQLFLLNGSCTVILWQDYYGKGNLRKSYLSPVGRRFPIGNVLFVHRQKGWFLSVYVDDIKLSGKKHNIVIECADVLNEEVDLGEPTSFFDHVFLGCIQRQCEISRDVVDNYRAMFESRISAGRTRKTSTLREFSFALSERLKNVSLVNTGTHFGKRRKSRYNGETRCLLWASEIGIRTIIWDLWGENNYLGKLHGSIFLWWWTGHQSSTHKKSTSSQILYCVLERYTRTPQSNKAWKDRLTWFKSSPEYRILDRIDGEAMEFEWDIFPGFTTLQLVREVQESLLRLSVDTRRILQDGSSSSRCSTTSHGDQETTRKNASQMLNSCLYLRKDSEQGQGSFLGPGSEKKWFSISEDSSQGEWERDGWADDV